MGKVMAANTQNYLLAQSADKRSPSYLRPVVSHFCFAWKSWPVGLMWDTLENS